MIFSSLFLLIGALISSNLIKQTRPRLLKTVAIVLISCVVLPLFNVSVLTTIAFHLFGISSLIFLIVSIQNKQWLSIIISFFVVLSIVFKTLHLPFGNELKLLMLIPIAAFVLTFINREKHQSVYAILIVLFASIFGELLTLWW